MKNRAYRSGHNSCRDRDRRQSHRPYRASKIQNNCCYGDRKNLSHNRFNSQDESKISGNCSQFDSAVESQGDRYQFFGWRRSRNNKFNFKSSNSHNCSQSPRSRGGC